jgi:hypothetical protein
VEKAKKFEKIAIDAEKDKYCGLLRKTKNIPRSAPS